MNDLILLAFNLIIFIILFVFSFYPWGLWLVQKIDDDLKPVEKIILAMLSSVVLFVVATLVSGILKIRFLILPLVLGANLFAIIKIKKELFIPWKAFFADKKLVLLVTIAIVVQGVINFPSGYLFKDGLMFWSSQGNDGLWHVALMEEAKKSMPLLNPIYSGEKLYNYHYLSDILMGEFGRIYPILTSLDLYFRFFPIVFSLFISLSVFAFVSRWRASNLAGYWAIFFTSLSGGFGYIVTYIKNRIIFGGETVFWAAQGNTIIGNPPHAVAYGLLSAALLAIVFYFKNRKTVFLYLAFILGSVLAGFKVSAGFVLAVGVIAAGIVDLIINHKKALLIYAGLLGLSSLGILKLMSKGLSSFLIWEPWWFVRTTITAPGRVEWMDLEWRRQYYMTLHTWKSYLRLIQFETEAFLIYVVGNLGTRFIGFFAIFEGSFKKVGQFFKNITNVLLLTAMTSGLVVTLLFVQKGIAYNLIQFMQYFVLIFGFFTAAFVATVAIKIKSRLVKTCLAIILIIFSLPTVIGNLVEFYGKDRTPLAKIDNNEIAALTYLKSHTPADAVVLTEPWDSNAHWAFKAQPWPISVWFSTAYVSAISSRRTFFSNEGQVDILGIPITERRNDVLKFFSQVDLNFSKGLLKNNQIGYIYLIKREITSPLNVSVLGLTKFYENDEVIIYKVI